MKIRRPTTTATALLAATLALSGAPAFAAGSSFTAKELQTIQDYYRDAGRGGRQALPPGVAKNLARGKALPPGLQTQSLPPALATSLPPPPAGYERVIVGAKVLLVETATRIIADIIADAILD